MDYLDPKKEVRERSMIMLGYILTAVAITLASLILLYRSYGFDLGQNGKVTHSSLTFISSQPNPADIYLNGKLYQEKTNARFELPEGTYQVKLTRTGYTPWERIIQVEGGKVEHFDYPLLIPQKLVAKKIDSYDAAPSFASQSLDRRWLLLGQGSATEFKLYDLKSKPVKSAETISLPTSVYQDSGTSSRLELVEWADDNTHLLVKHFYGAGSVEYIIINRDKPAESINLTKNLSLPQGELTLKNRKYDQYFLFNATAGTLQTATLEDALRPVLLNVLAFKSYSDDTLLYATNNGNAAGKVQVKLDIGRKSYVLRAFNPGSTFLLDLTAYSGNLYVAIGVTSQDRIYIYKDPVGQLAKDPKGGLGPQQVLHVSKPNRLSFSSSTQFIAAENGNHFAVYDLENKKGYHYTTTQPKDQPQQYATWMDGNRLTYISGGKHIIFDYDYHNVRTLSPSASGFNVMFSQTYDSVFNLAPSTAAPGAYDLNQTALLTPADQ